MKIEQKAWPPLKIPDFEGGQGGTSTDLREVCARREMKLKSEVSNYDYFSKWCSCSSARTFRWFGWLISGEIISGSKETPATTIIMILLLSDPKIQKYIENFTWKKTQNFGEIPLVGWLKYFRKVESGMWQMESGKWNFSIRKVKNKFQQGISKDTPPLRFPRNRWEGGILSVTVGSRAD